MRTLEWDPKNNTLKLIDQRYLPARFEIYTCHTYKDVIYSIKEMVVRGAPAIGVAAAYGMAIAAMHASSTTVENFKEEIKKFGAEMMASRPTAVNLMWAVRHILSLLDNPGNIEDYQKALLNEAHTMADEDVAINKKISEYGASLIEDGDTIIHHCNTGSLATVDWGTALGSIRMAHEQGKRIHVLVDETRPRLQGARLTAWELQQAGIPYDIISDNMSGHFMRTGQVNKVFFGADRVTANGDVANKIGSYMLALAAYTNKVPVYSVFPISTVDLSLANGALSPIEERDPQEVLNVSVEGLLVTPKGATARNPSFDVTPNYLITALVTELGVIYPPFNVNLQANITKNGGQN
ncbi:MAG: S-methyl-5-thioribose-1-phosphate isomerase [Anaerolineae bacterium]|nr:S-methyl-5-thioribose-1-phosphate isomerase [Anaerolineae bacterium]